MLCFIYFAILQCTVNTLFARNSCLATHITHRDEDDSSSSSSSLQSTSSHHTINAETACRRGKQALQQCAYAWSAQFVYGMRVEGSCVTCPFMLPILFWTALHTEAGRWWDMVLQSKLWCEACNSICFRWGSSRLSETNRNKQVEYRLPKHYGCNTFVHGGVHSVRMFGKLWRHIDGMEKQDWYLFWLTARSDCLFSMRKGKAISIGECMSGHLSTQTGLSLLKD